jgi:outer membrane protein
MIRRKLHVCAALLAAVALTFSPIYGQTPNLPQQPVPAAPPPGNSQTQPAVPAPPAASVSNTTTAPLPPTPPMKMSLGPDYSHGNRWFPDVTGPYRPQHVLQPQLSNSPRLPQLIQNGKLNLSVNDAIALAIENNLDIAVQRYTPWLDQMNLLLARSGQNGRITFDPAVTMNLNEVDATSPVANPLLSGVGVSSTTSALTQHTTTGNFGYTQGFATGTQVQMSFSNSRSSSSTSANVFNPSLSSTLAVSISQPLLNGFGFLANERFIIEGKNTVKVGEWQFKLAVINDITTTEDDYWNLVYGRQNVQVEQQTVAVDQQLYDDNEKQLQIGTMAPLDVLTAESQLASDQQALIVAQTQQLQFETKLLNDITKNPLDPSLSGVEVVPTTPISIADTVGNPPIEQAVEEAWQDRPEIKELELNLKNADIEVKVTTNEMLPSLSLVGQYSTTGLSGVGKKTTTTLGPFQPDVDEPIIDSSGTQATDALGNLEYLGVQPETVTTVPVPGGISDAWDALIHSRFPTFQAGLQMNLPIRNRANQANNGTALLNQRQQQVGYLEEKNTIFLAVRNALIAVTQDRAAVAAAAKARELAQETFDDEQKKYQLGSSTSYNVVLRSRDLTAAETTELQDQVNLVEAQIALDQAMGRTLESHNISISDAYNANATPVPNIPGAPIK